MDIEKLKTLRDLLLEYNKIENLVSSVILRSIDISILKAQDNYYSCKGCNGSGKFITKGISEEQAQLEAGYNGSFYVDYSKCKDKEITCKYCKGKGYFTEKPKEVYTTVFSGYEV